MRAGLICTTVPGRTIAGRTSALCCPPPTVTPSVPECRPGLVIPDAGVSDASDATTADGTETPGPDVSALPDAEAEIEASPEASFETGVEASSGTPEAGGGDGATD